MYNVKLTMYNQKKLKSSKQINHMNLHKSQGFSLIELIVVALVGIIALPIGQGIISAMNTNTKSRQMTDATIIAQQLAEDIELGGSNAVTSYFGSDPAEGASVVLTKSIDNFSYTVTCTKGGAVNALQTGAYVIKGFESYYNFEISSDGAQLILRKILTDNDGNSTSSDLSTITLSGTTDFSIVFADDDSIKIYENHQYDSSTVKDDITTELGSIDDVFDETNGAGFAVRISNLSTTPSNINIYNSTDDKEANIFYYQTAGNINPYIKCDKNVVIHDISNLSIDRSGITKMNTINYTLEIKKMGAPASEPALVTREITYFK